MRLFNDYNYKNAIKSDPEELEVSDYFYCFATNTHYRVLGVGTNPEPDDDNKCVTIECVETGMATQTTTSIGKALKLIKQANNDFDDHAIYRLKRQDVYMIFSGK